ncbi:MAG: hypothetical protein WCP77_21450 [Roseococcus sp.]
MRVGHRRAHLWIWCGLAVLLPALLGAALWQRATAPPLERPVRIAPP